MAEVWLVYESVCENPWDDQEEIVRRVFSTKELADTFIVNRADPFYWWIEEITVDGGDD